MKMILVSMIILLTMLQDVASGEYISPSSCWSTAGCCANSIDDSETTWCWTTSSYTCSQSKIVFSVSEDTYLRGVQVKTTSNQGSAGSKTCLKVRVLVDDVRVAITQASTDGESKTISPGADYDLENFVVHDSVSVVEWTATSGTNVSLEFHNCNENCYVHWAISDIKLIVRTCSVWPGSGNYGCTDGPDAWVPLDVWMGSSQTEDCENLCLQQSQDGCCYLSDSVGCYWKSNSEPYQIITPGISVRCSTYATTYFLGNPGGSCDAMGKKYITTLDECRLAIEELGIVSVGEWTTPGMDYVYGCSIKQVQDNMLHFNTWTSHFLRSSETPVCKN